MGSYSSWRDYQQATADVFRRLGCKAQVDFKARGVRAAHDIDVYVTFTRSSIPCVWVIECKLWKSSIPKEKVLALKAIVDDLGADRGILMSETGFQPGAQDAARGTNITLISSLSDFEETAVAAVSAEPLMECAEESGPSAFKFPEASGPSQMILNNDKIVVANWMGCNISIVNPELKTVTQRIELDKYEAVSPQTGARIVRSHPPGSLAIADGRLFVGQVFSDVVLVIDLATQAIVKRIKVPGGGEGELAVSQDEKTVYFASNRLSQFYVIDVATYSFDTVPYPTGGRGCMSLMCHPSKPLLHIGISRGGRINGRSYPHANSFLATYDLSRHTYVHDTQLAEITNGITDDATPASLTYDDRNDRLYVGMFQSLRGICIVDPDTGRLRSELRFKPHPTRCKFPWVDPLSQALSDSMLLTINRNNQELVSLERDSLEKRNTKYLGEAPNGPKEVLIWKDQAVVSYPSRNGLIFLPLGEL